MGKKKDILFLCQFFYPEYISSAQLPFETAVALKEAGFFDISIEAEIYENDCVAFVTKS